MGIISRVDNTRSKVLTWLSSVVTLDGAAVSVTNVTAASPTVDALVLPLLDGSEPVDSVIDLPLHE